MADGPHTNRPPRRHHKKVMETLGNRTVSAAEKVKLMSNAILTDASDFGIVDLARALVDLLENAAPGRDISGDVAQIFVNQGNNQATNLFRQELLVDIDTDLSLDDAIRKALLRVVERQAKATQDQIVARLQHGSNSVGGQNADNAKLDLDRIAENVSKEDICDAILEGETKAFSKDTKKTRNTEE